MTTIRTDDADDRAALVDLFARAGAGSPTGELWGHTASERAVYLDPYIEHCPGTLFLAEHEGSLIGYLTGCPDPSLPPRPQPRQDGQHPAVPGHLDGQVELGEHRPDVLVHGGVRQHEHGRDLGVRPALGHQVQHLAFA